MKQWTWCFVFFGLLAGVARADTIKLKDGTVLEGEILSETPTNLSVEVVLAGGRIISTEVLALTNIAGIVRLTPAEKRARLMQREFARMQAYALNSNTSFAVDYYDRVITDIFRRFLNEYPGSPHAAEVTERLTQWQAERDRVASGLTKFGGDWLNRAAFEQASRAEQTSGLFREAEQCFKQKNWADAARKYSAVLALGSGGGTAVVATRQLGASLEAWRTAIEQGQKKIDTEIPRTQRAIKDAQAAFDRAQSEFTQRIAFDSSGAKVARARTALTHAQNQLTQLQAGTATLKSQRVEVTQIATRNGLPDTHREAVATEVASRPAPPAPADSSTPDVVNQVGDFLHRYWLYGLVGVVVIMVVSLRFFTH